VVRVHSAMFIAAAERAFSSGFLASLAFGQIVLTIVL
jgi:hypothetical protein